MGIYTFWLAQHQSACTYLRAHHLSGPASYSVGIRGVMMCLYSWVLAHPRSRHLYNSICLTVKSGRAPAKTLAPCQGGQESNVVGCDRAQNQYQSSIYTSSPRTTPIHLPCFITLLRCIKVSILTAAEGAKVQFFNYSRQ